MKFRNTSQWPDWFIRRMMRWCCKALDLQQPPRAVQFRNRTVASWSGHAYLRAQRICVSIGPNVGYPMKCSGYVRACKDQETGEYPIFADNVEALVSVTAHELAHLQQWQQTQRYGRGGEDFAEARARYVLRQFREQRESLTAAWNIAPEAKPVASLTDQRRDKAERALSLWQRKLKLAQTKIRKYRRRVSYYERAAASKA